MRQLKTDELTHVVGGRALALYAALAGACLGFITGGLGSAVGHAAKCGLVTLLIEKLVLRKKKEKEQSALPDELQ